MVLWERSEEFSLRSHRWMIQTLKEKDAQSLNSVNKMFWPKINNQNRPTLVYKVYISCMSTYRFYRNILYMFLRTCVTYWCSLRMAPLIWKAEECRRFSPPERWWHHEVWGKGSKERETERFAENMFLAVFLQQVIFTYRVFHVDDVTALLLLRHSVVSEHRPVSQKYNRYSKLFLLNADFWMQHFYKLFLTILCFLGSKPIQKYS